MSDPALPASEIEHAMPDPVQYAKEATPVIIAGAPRSGTTFLTALLNTHPQILITNELRVWTLFNDIRRRTAKPSELLPEHPLRDEFRREMIRVMPAMFDRFYRSTVDKTNVGCPTEQGGSVPPVIKAFGDKNPGYADTHHAGNLTFIAKSLPQAKFLHIHRDPRACVASYLDIAVYPNKLEKCIDIWRRHTASMLDMADELGPNRVMTLSYEALVTADGESLLRAIERHIGVDAAEEPIAFLERERKTPIPYRSPTTETEKLGRPTWRTRLNSSTAQTIEDSCADLVKRLYGTSLLT